jgi:hypothetical protein
MKSATKCTKQWNLHFLNFKIENENLKILNTPADDTKVINAVESSKLHFTSWDYPFKVRYRWYSMNEPNFECFYYTDFLHIFQRWTSQTKEIGTSTSY